MRKNLSAENPEFTLKKEAKLKNGIDYLDKKSEPENLETLEAQEKNFGERLDDLKAAITEMEKHGEEINEEMFENIMGVSFNEFRDYVDGGKIIEQKDLKSFHKKVSEIINGGFNEAYAGNRFRNVMNKPLSRTLFAAVCLFLKFGVPAQAHNNETAVKDKVINSTEVSAPNNLGGGPDAIKINDHNYKINLNEPNRADLKEAAVVDITQGFVVDKAAISDKDAQEIEKEIDAFLNKINPDNFKRYDEAKKIVYGSSDSRATKYGAEDKKLAPALENNIPLSKDRCLEGIRVIKDAFKNHDYSKSGLSQEQIDKIIKVEPEFKIPEKGYTKISELNEINPKTGEKYTDQDVKEIEKNNPELYKALNDKCRYVKLDLMVESALKKLNQCDRVLFFIDNSPSTEYTMDDMAKKLEELGIQENNKGNIAKADLVYFTNDASPVKNLPNIMEAANDLKRVVTKGSSIENPFKSSINYFKTLIKNDTEIAKNGGEVEDYRTAVYTTDEGLQDAQNIFEAAKLAQEAHVKDANVFLYSRNNPKPLEKNLFELRDQIEKIVKTKIELNLLTLEQEKQNEEQNINNLIAEANEKISPKALKEFFGQDKLGNENEELKIIIEKKHQASYLQNSKNPSQEKAIISKLFKSINNLEKTNNLLSEAKAKTFENYLETTRIEIKVFTNDKGEKTNFNVVGYEPLAKNTKLEEIKL